jgi:hypothetical protein
MRPLPLLAFALGLALAACSRAPEALPELRYYAIADT